MLDTRRGRWALFVSLTLLVGMFAGIRAQESLSVDARGDGPSAQVQPPGLERVSVDARGGVGVPVSDLADLTGAGPTVSVGLAYRLLPRLALRGDAGLDLYSGADFTSATARVSTAPDVRLWRVTGGVEVRVLEPGPLPLTVSLTGAGGFATLVTDEFPLTRNPATGDFRQDFGESWPTAVGGLKVDADLAPRIGVFARGEWNLTFADEDETLILERLSGGDVAAFDQASTILATAGVSIRL